MGSMLHLLLWHCQSSDEDTKTHTLLLALEYVNFSLYCSRKQITTFLPLPWKAKFNLAS